MSAIKPGDRVKFVNENLEGIVTSVQGSIAGVTIGDDFEIPVPVSDLVKITGSQNHKAEKEIAEPVAEVPPSQRGIFIAFDRVSDTSVELKLYNGDSEEILFCFYEKQAAGITLKKHGNIKRGNIAELGRYDIEKFSQWPEFCFQCLCVDRAPSALPLTINRSMRIASREFHGSFRQTFFLARQAYLFRLDQQTLPTADLEKLLQKDFSEKKPEERAAVAKPASVVDLHIEHLCNDPSLLSAMDIVQEQMNTFIKSLDLAQVHKMQSIIFIHGVGNHYLKNKIRNYLSLHKKSIASFADADMIKYGGGATQVFLK